MGMYDTVHFTCPKCDRDLAVQSKAGDCRLSDIDCSAVPLDIADDISGEEVFCDPCGRLWTIVSISPPPKTKVLALVQEYNRKP